MNKLGWLALGVLFGYLAYRFYGIGDTTPALWCGAVAATGIWGFTKS